MSVEYWIISGAGVLITVLWGISNSALRKLGDNIGGKIDKASDTANKAVLEITKVTSTLEYQTKVLDNLVRDMIKVGEHDTEIALVKSDINTLKTHNITLEGRIRDVELHQARDSHS